MQLLFCKPGVHELNSKQINAPISCSTGVHEDGSLVGMTVSLLTSWLLLVFFLINYVF